MDKKYDDNMQAVRAFIRNQAVDLPMDYFFEITGELGMDETHSNTPCIAILGMGCSEIYIRALGIRPLFLLGGDYFVDKRVDQIFPQVSDPVLKSACSTLFSKIFSKEKNLCGIVVHINNTDSRKVLPYLNDIGLPIMAFEEAPIMREKMTSAFKQAEGEFIEKLQRVAHRKMTTQGMMTAMQNMTKAHEAKLKLQALAIPQCTKDFILQTYYFAPDIQVWTEQVEKLVGTSTCVHNTYTHNACMHNKKVNQLVLMGSPISYPNYKIPMLLHRVGLFEYKNLCIGHNLGDYTQVLSCRSSQRSMLRKVQALHYQWAQKDSSHTLGIADSFLKQTEGVIYHLLKGQLMYAYEAERIEREAIKAGVPFVCIETDYTNADIEQIGIRLEAFSELLSQKRRRY